MRIRLIGVILLSIIFCLFSPKIFSNKRIDSLNKLSKSKIDTVRVRALSDLCWEYRFISSDSAFNYGQKALMLAIELDWDKGIAQAYNDLGIVYIDQNKYDHALDFFDRSMKIRKQMHDSSGVASLFNKIGIIHQKQGDLEKALDNQLKALRMYERMGRDLWIGYCLNNIAIIHQNIGNYEKSLEAHLRALDIRIEQSDKYGEGGSYGNIANVYLRTGDTVRAGEYYEKAVKIFREMASMEALAVMLNNLGGLHVSSGDYKKALEYLREAFSIRVDLGDKKAIASTLIGLGEAYTNLSMFREARRSLFKALELAQQAQVMEETKMAYQKISTMYYSLNKHDSAFYYQNLYASTIDSVYESRLNARILELQTKYDVEQLRKDQEIKNLTIKQQHTQNSLLIALMVFFIALTLSWYFRYKQKQRALLNAEIIRQQELRMRAVLETQEEERDRIARELHDGVGQMLSGLKMNWQSVLHKIIPEEKSQPPRIQEIDRILDEVYHEVRNISHQMMPKVLREIGLFAAIEDMLEKNLKKTRIEYELESIGKEEKLKPEIELNLFRVCQELLSNVIKHANADRLELQLINRKNVLLLLIEDNGKGFEYEKNSEKGIGLLNIASRITLLRGEIKYEQAERGGTRVSIRIPKL